MTKPKPLTMAQVYTLRRLDSGTKYIMRGDSLKADEQRPEGYRRHHPVAAPSIPPLARFGLVEFVPMNRDRINSLYYPVRLTETGRMMITLTKDRTE